jgi:4-azaleucine resistance transporter AzlC
MTLPSILTQRQFKAAFRDALPIMVGYFPIAFAFGVLAESYIGWYGVLMSALVFAGASQFIALQMLMQKSPASLIVATTFLVNLRHILMSSYISALYSRIKASWSRKALISFGITDETFAIASRRLNEIPDSNYHLLLNLLCYVAWIGGTVAGLLFGSVIPLDVVNVLPFALTSLFITLMVLSVGTSVDIVVAVFAGVVSVILSSLPSGWSIMISALAACLLGGVVEKWTS